jgi:hypothetical protein
MKKFKPFFCMRDEDEVVEGSIANLATACDPTQVSKSSKWNKRDELDVMILL